MHAIERMIQAYHDLCEREPHLVEESAAMLQAEQPKRRLLFGDRLLCNVLRPHFLTHEQYTYIRKRIALVADALRNAFDALMHNATLRAELFLSPMEEEVIHYDFGYATPVPTSRMDTFLSHDGTFHFVEYNAETPAGTGYEVSIGKASRHAPNTKSCATTSNARATPPSGLTPAPSTTTAQPCVPRDTPSTSSTSAS